MAVRRVEWPLLILVILKIAFSSSEETCRKLSVCSCQLSNGQKIDLKPVDGTATAPSFTELKSADGSTRTFDWNPCTPFTVDQLCTQANVLVAQLGAGECFPAGTDDTSFSVDSADSVVVTYGGITSAGAKRSAKITLKCDPKVTSKKGTWSDFKETKESGSPLYSATYTSSYNCATGPTLPPPSSGGLSVGSILLIIFFPLVLMYLVIGVLINHYGRGIQSVPEVIPNHSFWADFPFLVKDGVVFTCGCIKGLCSSLYQKCNKDGYAKI